MQREKDRITELSVCVLQQADYMKFTKWGALIFPLFPKGCANVYHFLSAGFR